MKRLGDILIESGFLTAAELAEALSVQKDSGKRLGEVITEMGLMTEFDILRAVSSQYNYPIIDLTSIEVDPKAMALLDEKFCTDNTVVPIGFDDNNLVVAIDAANSEIFCRPEVFAQVFLRKFPQLRVCLPLMLFFCAFLWLLMLVLIQSAFTKKFPARESREKTLTYSVFYAISAFC